jgi:prepilin peptidase CpaA
MSEAVVLDASFALGLAKNGLLVMVLAAAVVADVRTRRIPNVLTFPFMLAGLALNAASGGIDGLIRGVFGLLLGAAILLVPVAMRWWGAGDLKLLAAVGAIGGPMFVLWCALFAMIAGGMFAAVTAARRRQLAPIVAGLAVDLWTQQKPHATSGLRNPYSLAIAAGAVAALLIR